MDQLELTTHQFGSTAAKYLTSAVHASGADIERLVEIAARSPPALALDLGSGAGHVSFALARGGARRVVAYDPAAQMLGVVAAEAAARAHSQIETLLGSAERLPFDDAAFDLIVSRYSAHHWLDVRRAMSEAERVLAPGGTLIVIDVLAPETPLMDTVLQSVEMLRDASHVRNYRESEWRAMFESANLKCRQVDRWKLPLEFQSWITRIGTPPARVDALKTVFDALPAEAREYFSVASDHSFVIDSGWLEACKDA
jgi:ubiquinone/menaquinone biosynthesis C-methylase UbiE